MDRHAKASSRTERATRTAPQPWLKRLDRLPAVRWAKVAYARHAIVACRYDADECLDEVMGPLAQAVGVALRDDPAGGC